MLSAITTNSWADVTPSPYPSPTSAPDSYKIVMEQFKKDREVFELAVRERSQKIRIINQAFESAIKKARQDAKYSMQVALKPEQKSATTSNLKSSIATAIMNRENAIVALGEPPIPPTEPSRNQKEFRPAKDGGGKNRR